MESAVERLQLLGLVQPLSQDFLFDWKQRSLVLNFLVEKMLNGMSVSDLCQALKMKPDDCLAEASMLSRVLNFLGIPATPEEVLGDGGIHSRSQFLERILAIVENHPHLPNQGPGHLSQGDSKQDIEEIRLGMASNMALISAAVRSRKGCLVPKVNPLPQTIMVDTHQFRDSTVENIFDAVSDTSMVLEAEMCDGKVALHPQDENAENFTDTLHAVKERMQEFNHALQSFSKVYQKSRKDPPTHSNGLQGLGMQAAAILGKYDQIMQVASSFKKIKSLRDSIIPDQGMSERVQQLVEDAQHASLHTSSNCDIMKRALFRTDRRVNSTHESR